MSASFRRFALHVPIIGIFLKEHCLINRKLLKKLSAERRICLRLPYLSSGKPSVLSKETPAPKPQLAILFYNVLQPVLPS